MSGTRTNKVFQQEVATAVDFTKRTFGSDVDVAIVLGSGLQGFSGRLEDQQSLIYEEIPHFPRPSVAGHAGKLVFGHIGDKKVLCFAGRVHAYEGTDADELVFSVLLARGMGAKLFVATNASGGCQKGMEPGCLMSVTDFLNLHHANPLSALGYGGWGSNWDNTFIPFPSSVFSDRCKDMISKISAKVGLSHHEGIYCWTTGPTYETSSEVAAGIRMHASAFGMSTVPEIMASAGTGMELCVVSLITNVAAGILEKELSHEEVQDCAAAAGPKFQEVMMTMISEIDLSTHRDGPAQLYGEDSPSFALKERLDLPTKEEVSKVASLITGAIDEVKADTGCAGEVIAVFSDAVHTDAVLNGLTSTRGTAVPLRSSRLVDESGERAEEGVQTTVGVNGGKIYVVMSMPAHFGLDRLQSLMVVRALTSIGIAELRFAVTVFSTSLENEIPRAVRLTDVALLSSNLPLSSTHTSEGFPLAVNSMPELFTSSKKQGGVDDVFVYALEGPTLPSIAEMKYPESLEVHAVSTFLFYPAFEGKVAGIPMRAYASISSFSPVGDLHVDSAKMKEVMRESVNEKQKEVASLIFSTSAEDGRSSSSSPTPTFDHAVLSHTDTLPELDHDYISGLRSRIDSVLHMHESRLHLAQSDLSPTAFCVSEEESGMFLKAVEGVIDRIPFRNIRILDEYALSIVGSLKETVEPQVVLVKLPGGKKAVAFIGLSSLGNGVSVQRLGFPVRFAKQMGIKHLVVISRGTLCAEPLDEEGEAVGASEVYFIVKDHLATTGKNPLFGPNDNEWGARFPDMSFPYDKRAVVRLEEQLRTVCEEVDSGRGKNNKVEVMSGTVGWVAGGSSLTKAVVSRAAILGADMVCACGVAEVITARHMGLSITSIIRAQSTPHSDEEGETSTTAPLIYENLFHFA